MGTADGLRAVVGEPTDPEMLAALLPDHDVVISCIGQRGRGDAGILRQSASAMVRAIGGAPAPAFLVLSQGLLFQSRNPLVLLVKRILSRHVDDSLAMEVALRASDVDWTIVRPPRLRDGGRRRGYRIAVNERPSGPASMQRADLAAFLLDEAETRQHSRQVVGVTSA